METNELLEIYFSEADDLLKALEKNLLVLETSPKDPDLIRNIFRSVHTLKSSSAMVGFEGITEYAHRLENLLERLRSGKLSTSQALISFLLLNHSKLKEMVARALRGEEPVAPSDMEAQKEQIVRFMGLEGEKEEAPPEPLSPREKETFYHFTFSFKEDLFYTGQDPMMLLLELKDLGDILKIEADISKIPDIREINPYTLYLSWRVLFRTLKPRSLIEEVFCFVKEDHPILIRDVTHKFPQGIDSSLAGKRLGDILLEDGLIESEDLYQALQAQKKVGEVLVEQGKVKPETLSRIISEQEQSRSLFRKSTIRVDTQKLDLLANLVEEISVHLSRMSYRIAGKDTVKAKQIEEEIEKLERVNREIQEKVMSIRMFPLEGTFQRFQRLARDLAQEEGKQIRVETEGAETELDKDIIEQITDPLKHLIRNAIDHGIESPEERKGKGKGEQGLLMIKALQREGKIVIQVKDDGRGLDEEAIYDKAMKVGLIPGGTRPLAAEVYKLIFQPGFSTAKEVTEVSGRGVGMDVVYNQITGLGGSVELASLPGRGTTITLGIPLTLAIVEGLRVQAGTQTFIVPLRHVLTAKKISPGELKTVETREKMLFFEEKYLSAVSLALLLGEENERLYGDQIALIIEGPSGRFGLLVDQILETQPWVIKTLEDNFRSIPGVSGGAILGDGSVCLILDVFSLDKMIFRDISVEKF